MSGCRVLVRNKTSSSNRECQQATAENCERLTEDALTSTINYVASKCRIREHQLQKAANSLELIKLVEPDFGHFFAWDRHPDVVEEAKQLWGFRG